MIKFSTNPLLFKVQYINRDRFDTTQGIASVLGNSFHQAMAVYSGGSDELIPMNEPEAIKFGMESGMDFLEKYNDGFIEWSEKIPNKQKAFDKFTFIYQAYITEMSGRQEETISVEEMVAHKIDVEWRGHKIELPVKLKGKMDKVFRQDGKLKVKDYKTSDKFSDPDKIDGKKMIQAVVYYFLAYAEHGEEPYSVIFEEVKHTKNQDGSPQVRSYEIVFADNPLYFDFFFRFYEDMTRALNGEMVYVPNLDTFYDNEVGIISYIHRLDVPEDTAKLMKNHQVTTLTELLKKEIQSAGNMRKLMKAVEDKFVSAKNLNYESMTNQEKIQTKMMEHGMLFQFDSIVEGTTVDLYQYTPSIGLKMSRVRNYVEDVEQVLGVSGVRILAPIPNTNLVGFEVPRAERIYPELPSSTGFDLAIGRGMMGKDRYYDIRTAPHILVGGSSGSGKSYFLHSLIKQIMKIPNAELHLFDPKQVELSQYEGMVAEYEHNGKKIVESLLTIALEMEERYNKMKVAGVKHISGMPDMKYKFVIVDEYADLAMRSSIAEYVQIIAQKGRAAGIHLIIATQRASTKIINGDIKTNFPTKVVFKMAKAVDSRVMLDEEGAEKLLKWGDMLFVADNGIERLQGYRP